MFLVYFTPPLNLNGGLIKQEFHSLVKLATLSAINLFPWFADEQPPEEQI